MSVRRANRQIVATRLSTATPSRRTGWCRRSGARSRVVSCVAVVAVPLIEPRSCYLDVVVLLDNGPERLENHLSGQRRDVEIFGHPAVGHFAASAGDGEGEPRREAGDAVSTPTGLVALPIEEGLELVPSGPDRDRGDLGGVGECRLSEPFIPLLSCLIHTTCCDASRMTSVRGAVGRHLPCKGNGSLSGCR